MLSTNVKTYDDLRHAISQTRIESRLRTEKAVEEERVREAWQIGKLIDAHVLQHKERASYRETVLERLAADLGMSRTELYYMLEFARTYPIVQPAGQLSWSQYCELLAVNSLEERTALAERSVKESWTRDQLREEVKIVTRRAKGTSTSPEPETLPASAPGKPGTYRVITAKVGPYSGELALDLGFSDYVRLSIVIPKSNGAFKAGDIVVSSFDAVGREEDLFTYEAYVYRVLDGDTIEAVVDLGFGFATTQTLRLRGIDAPELATHDGMSAKEALEKMLARSPRVLIRSVKSDKYDRYLADVYGVDAQGKVSYLNNLLLEQGYAVMVGE